MKWVFRSALAFAFGCVLKACFTWKIIKLKSSFSTIWWFWCANVKKKKKKFWKKKIILIYFQVKNTFEKYRALQYKTHTRSVFLSRNACIYLILVHMKSCSFYSINYVLAGSWCPLWKKTCLLLKLQFKENSQQVMAGSCYWSCLQRRW